MTENKHAPAERIKYVANGYFYKIYRTSDLLESGWEARVQAIEELSSLHHLIPEVTFEWSADGKLIYRQQRIRKAQLPSRHLMPLLVQLAVELERLSTDGFVHGDINRKNLLFDGASLRLIDLEPSLRQRRKGCETLLYTPPYITLCDFRQDRFTPCTDKVGFYFFCRRMLSPIPQFSPRGEMKRIEAGCSIIERYTAMEEEAFCRLKYLDIMRAAAAAAAAAAGEEPDTACASG